MMTSKRMFLIMMAGIACVLLVSCSDKKTGGNAERWINYGTTEDGSQKYYDKQSITQISPNIVKVWDKGKLSPGARDIIIEQRKRSGLAVDGWDKLDHVILVREINCGENTGKIIRVEDYNDTGKMFSESDFPNAKSEPIPSGSMNELLLKKVCTK
jgi:hypothetical protein